MLTAGENPHGSFPQVKVKVEDTHETSMTSAPTSTTNTAEKQIMVRYPKSRIVPFRVQHA